MTSTAESIENSLHANRRLQHALLSRIQNISRLKKKNRQTCANIVFAVDTYLSERKRQCLDTKSLSNSSDFNHVDQHPNSISSSVRKRKWSYNENRKWTKRFFVDPDRTLPEPNSDILCRREWEGDIISMDKGRLQAWTQNELNVLKKCGEIVREQQREENDIQMKDADIDFERVSQLVQEKISVQKVSTRQEKKKYIRAVSDYRIKFLTDASPSINKARFTKKESLKIIELFHKHHGHPRWDVVARALNTNRTPFQCFRYAQSKLVTTSMLSSSTTLHCNPSLWSQTDDELILKFVAASGPQIVINRDMAIFLSQRFFPHLDKNQILNRCHNSLVNPNFKRRKWSEKEERLLVLGMRLFCEDDSAITKVVALFPDRSTYSIAEKWFKSLDPQYTSQPFTERDDEALLAAVKSSGSGPINWMNISKMFARHPRRVLNRWVELSKKQDIYKMKGDFLIKNMIAQPSVFGDGNCHADDEYLLSPDDFVVCVKERQKVRG